MRDAELNQKQLAQAASVSESAVVNYLRNDRLPKVEELKRIADVLHVTPGWLMGWDREAQDETRRFLAGVEAVVDTLDVPEAAKEAAFNELVHQVNELKGAVRTARVNLDSAQRALDRIGEALDPRYPAHKAEHLMLNEQQQTEVDATAALLVEQQVDQISASPGGESGTPQKAGGSSGAASARAATAGRDQGARRGPEAQAPTERRAGGSRR